MKSSVGFNKEGISEMKDLLCLGASSTMILIGMILITLTGCGSSKSKANLEAPKVYKIATRQHAPELVYNPVRWVRPPVITPSRKVAKTSAPLIVPVVHFTVKNEPLCEAALVLAAPSRYSTYCASHLKSHKISLNMIGTMDEVGDMIAHDAGIKVIVDHNGQEVRFLGKSLVEPKF